MIDASAIEREPKVGGPVDPEDNLYISRQVDEEFIALLKAREFVNLITSRQMGKTSMVYRAVAELAPQGYRFAYFDLSKLRSEPDARRYFRSLIDDIARELALGLDLGAFWTRSADKANGQIIVDFFRLVLEALPGPVVVVLDEIDSTLESTQLGFTDDLFTAIRGMYSSRPREPSFKRLTFCLVGVATPNELIKARRTTPYNIGRTLWLDDFDPAHDDLSALTRLLGGDAKRANELLARVLHWTGGQPYLTMFLCDELRRAGVTDAGAVDTLVERTYASRESLRGDTHFEQVERFIGERPGTATASLDIYERILKGTAEADQPANPAYAHLKLSGLVKRDGGGMLVVRNPIYRRLFDLDWVRTSRPRRELRSARKLSYVAVSLLVLGLIGGGAYYQFEVAPLKAQEEARSALKDLGVEVNEFEDPLGRSLVRLTGKAASGDAQSALAKAAPHLANLGRASQSKGLRLDLDSTAISDLTPLAGVKGLVHLNLSKTKVADLTPLAGLTQLVWLDVSGTAVKDLAPLGGLKQLQSLDASETEVASLAPLASHSALRELGLARASKLADLSPLRGLNALKRLDVSYTAVRDLAPLSGLVALEYLNVSHTGVAALTALDGLAQLRLLEIDGLGSAGYPVGSGRPWLRVFGGADARAAPAPQRPGQVFRDCDLCPEMVVIPAGSFEMGSTDREKGRFEYEGPQHRVTIVRAFAAGKYEVTFEEWDACVTAGGCQHKPDDSKWGRGRQPAINVSWDDAQAYVAWLSKETGKAYRLLSEAEWEYAARGGMTTRYPWGDEVGTNQANFDGSGSQWSGKQTAPVGSFAANRFGLYDVSGNVWEWVEDCYRDGYQNAPEDGRPWTSAVCLRRVVRGGSWLDVPGIARVAFRSGNGPAFRYFGLGFRLARTL